MMGTEGVKFSRRPATSRLFGLVFTLLTMLSIVLRTASAGTDDTSNPLKTFASVIAAAQQCDPHRQKDVELWDRDKAVRLYQEAIALRPDEADNVEVEFEIAVLLTHYNSPGKLSRLDEGLTVLDNLLSRYRNNSLTIARAAMLAGDLYKERAVTGQSAAAETLDAIREFEPNFLPKADNSQFEFQLNTAQDRYHYAILSLAGLCRDVGVKDIMSVDATLGKGAKDLIDIAVQQYVDLASGPSSRGTVAAYQEVAKEYSGTLIADLCLAHAIDIQQLEQANPHVGELPNNESH